MIFSCKPKLVLTDKQKTLIEKIGISYESEGLQPVAGRILGLLYVSDNPHLTFDEITEALQISKSATSNGINLLLQMQRIEYITFSGDRRRYFRLKVSNWREEFKHKIEVMAGFNSLMREVLALRTKETPEYNERIKELADFLDYVFQQLPLLLQQWDQEKTRKS
ncbi:MarR family transcriptional regulator [Adhaeribacter rhizoryzae]|uniref:MarR family transcriptional regulator n=1 Tax=Adhaeribacter rhizoryzae TaxID=2607907 RepID=A0A5M6DJV1_9BACT|nr:MarR family transcriptional regulator [Adhaeribacter rhizoryzae]